MNKKLCFILAIVVCLWGWSVWGATPEVADTDKYYLLPTVEEISEELEKLKTDNLSNEEKEKLTQLLKNGLNILDKLDQARQDLKNVQNITQNNHTELKALHREYEQANKKYKTLPDVSKLSGEQLTHELEQAKTDNDLAQSELKQVTANYNRIQTLPERAQSNILKNNQQIDKQLQQVNHNKVGSTIYDRLIDLQIAYLRKKNEAIQAELSEQIILLDEADYKLRIQQLKAEYYQKLLTKLQDRQNEVLSAQIETEATLLTTKDQKSGQIEPSDPSEYDSTPELDEQIKINVSIGRALNEQLKFNLKLNEMLQKLEDATALLEQIQTNLISQIEGMDKTILLSRILNRQQIKIAEIKLERLTIDSISDVNLKLFDIRSYRNALFDLEEHVDELIVNQPQLASNRDALLKIFKQRKELINQLNQQFSSTLSTEISLKVKNDKFERLRAKLQSKITENMFWLKSNQSLGKGIYLVLDPAVKHFMSNLRRKWRSDQTWSEILHTMTIMILPALLLAIFIRFFLAQRLMALANQLARRLDGPLDNLWVTPRALLVQFILMLPNAMLWFVFGAVIICLANVEPALHAEVMGMLVIHILVFVFFWEILQPNGFAQRHLCINPYVLANNRKLLSKVWYAMIPLLVIGRISESSYDEIYFDVIGQIIMLISSLYLCLISGVWIKNRIKQGNQLSLMLWISSICGFVTFLWIFIMLASGYVYTTVKIINRIAYTAYLGAFFWFFAQLIRRSIYVLGNEISLNRGDFLSLRNLGTRFFRFVRLILLSLTLCCMYYLWDDLAGALNYLDTITIWSKTEMVNNTEVTVAKLSLMSVIVSVLILMFTLYLSKNVPVILERLIIITRGKGNSTSYTVKIISSYAIMTLGVILSAGSLGLTWEDMQWLVAALSVGLGFGLQEIFANFVSGVIILFERQLRVGDIITLDSMSGRVSKIRIRATTILSFDNKEVMIPNKAFITKSLTNWSLSNTITKLEYAVRISFDSDVDKAKMLIKQIVSGCPFVVKGAPAVIFISAIADNKINIQCEVQVSEINKRKPTFDYLSHEILKLFGENQIKLC